MEALCLRVVWSDWRSPEPARFDLLDMIDFCRTLPQGWSVRILNATGRVEGQRSTGRLGEMAEVEFRFPDEPSLAAFRSRFGSAVMPASGAARGS